MHKIFKYELYLSPTQVIKMVQGAEIIHVHSQDFYASIWAIIDLKYLDAPLEFRTIRTVPTGVAFLKEEWTRYLGTLHSKGLVFHIFEEVKQDV